MALGNVVYLLQPPQLAMLLLMCCPQNLFQAPDRENTAPPVS
jgi:hypothetical protein